MQSVGRSLPTPANAGNEREACTKLHVQDDQENYTLYFNVIMTHLFLVESMSDFVRL
jgi:hypothetical protein